MKVFMIAEVPHELVELLQNTTQLCFYLKLQNLLCLVKVHSTPYLKIFSFSWMIQIYDHVKVTLAILQFL